MIPDEEDIYTLEVIARISGVDAETILHYQEQGFIRPVRDSGEQYNNDALLTLRRIEHLRRTCDVNETGLRIILGLMSDLEQLRAALDQKW
jgi:MerR family transcriptional regulator/heat shock protein HspR